MLAHPLLRMLHLRQSWVRRLPRAEELAVRHRRSTGISYFLLHLGKPIKRETRVGALHKCFLESSFSIRPFTGCHHGCRFTLRHGTDIEGRLVVPELLF